MIRFFPFNIFEIGEVESYLHDMAAKGYILTDIIFFAHYKKSEPTNITYRLEPITKDEDGPSDEIKEIYEQFGWHYVCTVSNKFYIFASYDEEPIEVHTAPQIYSSFKYLEKKLRMSNIATVVIIPIAIIAIIYTFMNIKYPIRTFVRSGSCFYMIFAILLVLFGTIVEIRRNKRIKTLLNNLKNGIPIKHRVKYKKRYANVILTLAVILMNIMNIFLVLYNADAFWYKSVDSINGVLPTVTIYEMEKGKDCIIEYDNKFNDVNSVNGNNYFDHDSSDLAPEILHIVQRGIVEGEMWEDGSGEYTPNITTEYYRLRFKFIRDAFVKDLIAHDAEFNYNEITSKEILNTDFDYAYLICENEMQYLYAYKDNKVIAITYQGYGDLKEHIEEIENRVEVFKEIGER